MLDKSVPYIDVMMHRPSGAAVSEFPLPEGYTFSLFQAGDERAWAEIEASVGEFDTPIDALLYFQKTYLPYARELERRCMFVKNPTGDLVATAMAYWEYSGIRRQPWLHWVSVRPDYQNLGLGKAIASKVVCLMIQIEGDCDFYLHTQTWSHKAIGIYEKLGFYVTDERNLGNCANDRYEEAIKLLAEIRAKK